MNRWYIVHTQPNGEERARYNLERQGFGTYLPKYLKHCRHARRVEPVHRPLFPRYLFVRFDPDTAQWRSINGTFGVAHLVSNGNEPVALPESVVEAIQARHNDNDLVVLHAPDTFDVGQKIWKSSMARLPGKPDCSSASATMSAWWCCLSCSADT